MSFLSKWFKSSDKQPKLSIKKLVANGDVDGLFKVLQDRLKTKSLHDLQETIVIIRHLKDLSDRRGIESLPAVFNALFSCKEANPSDRHRLGLEALQSVDNTGDASHIEALKNVEAMLDGVADFMIQMETAAPTLIHLDDHKQSKAIVKELRKEITTILAKPR